MPAEAATLNYYRAWGDPSLDAALEGVQERGSTALFDTALVGCTALFIRLYFSSGFDKCAMIRK